MDSGRSHVDILVEGCVQNVFPLDGSTDCVHTTNIFVAGGRNDGDCDCDCSC